MGDSIAKASKEGYVQVPLDAAVPAILRLADILRFIERQVFDAEISANPQLSDDLLPELRSATLRLLLDLSDLALQTATAIQDGQLTRDLRDDAGDDAVVITSG